MADQLIRIQVTDARADWTCDTGASLIAEATTPGPGRLGTIHAVIYVCPDHQDAAEDLISSHQWNPAVRPAPPSHQWNPWPCGHITAYDASTPAETLLTEPRTD